MKKHLGVLVFLFFISLSYSNGNLPMRIELKTAQINIDPTNPQLYFERGYLYQQNEQYKEAIGDYLTSEKLGYSENALFYRQSESYYFNKEYQNALKAVTRYLKLLKKDVKGHKLKAKIYHKLKLYTEAAESYRFVVQNMEDIMPWDYIEFSKTVLEVSDQNYSKATEIIDEGLKRLGDNVLSLQLKKLEYFKLMGNPDKVINHYNYFILNTKRREFWYYKKAKYLAQIEKLEESKIALEQAKMSIKFLSERFQNLPSIKNLILKIDRLEKRTH